MILDKGLPEDGAVKKAQRGGRWTTAQQIAAESVNEQYRFRAAYQGSRGGEEWYFDPSEFEIVDPAMQALHDEAAALEDAEASEAQRQFESESGYS